MLVVDDDCLGFALVKLIICLLFKHLSCRSTARIGCLMCSLYSVVSFQVIIRQQFSSTLRLSSETRRTLSSTATVRRVMLNWWSLTWRSVTQTSVFDWTQCLVSINGFTCTSQYTYFWYPRPVSTCNFCSIVRSTSEVLVPRSCIIGNLRSKQTELMWSGRFESCHQVSKSTYTWHIKHINTKVTNAPQSRQTEMRCPLNCPNSMSGCRELWCLDVRYRAGRSELQGSLIVWGPSTVGGRTFSVAGPTVWNSLTDNLTSAQLLSTFCQHLKTFLFSALFPGITLDNSERIPHLQCIWKSCTLLGPH